MTLKEAVERSVRGDAKHLESVPVVETFRGQIVWDGIVEVFTVAKPPPDRAYVWKVESATGPEPEYVTVLGNPPIDSPLAAVRAWLVSEARKTP
ncbi:MAG: hypothetical protein ABSE62_15680 [Chthoniobacteraceae bacterium]